MGDLYPTKTRLALLRDVGAARVYYAESGQIMRNTDGRFPLRATVAVKELERAGWVHLGKNGTYELTTEGGEVLAGGGR
jgi:hypothetical protein